MIQIRHLHRLQARMTSGKLRERPDSGEKQTGIAGGAISNPAIGQADLNAATIPERIVNERSGVSIGFDGEPLDAKPYLLTR